MPTTPAQITVQTAMGDIRVTVEMLGPDASQRMINGTATTIQRALAAIVPNVSPVSIAPLKVEPEWWEHETPSVCEKNCRGCKSLGCPKEQ